MKIFVFLVTNLIRLDRKGKIGGGVAFLTSDSLVVKRRRDLELIGFEFLWIEFRIRGCDFLCGVCYRPPNNHNASLSFFSNVFSNRWIKYDC